jgi:hypothetical protein
VKWAAGPFQSVALPDGRVALHPLTGGTVVETTPQVAQFLEEARNLREGERHISRWLNRAEQMRLPAAVVMSQMEHWRQSGLLWNEEDVEKAWYAMPASSSAISPLAWAAIPTRNHPELALRAAESLCQSATREGRKISVVVADDSPDPGMRDELAGGLEGLSRASGHRIFALGHRARQAWIQDLSKEGEIDPDVLRFAFSDPLGFGFACGANRNFILSLLTDERFVSMDDDIQLDFLASSEAQTGFTAAYTRDPFTWWFGGDAAELASQGRKVQVPFWESMDRVLGRTPAEASQNLEPDWEDFDPKLFTLEGGALRVAACFPGLWGYPPVQFTAHLLAFQGNDLLNLIRDREKFSEILRSGRQAAVASRPSCTNMNYFPGMCMGLDHSRFLPPFLPILHGEDAAYGCLLTHIMPDALAWHHPWAALHDPGKNPELCTPTALHPANQAPCYELHHTLGSIWTQIPECLIGSGPESNTQRMGVWLKGLASLNLPDWKHLWFDLTARYKSKEINMLRSRMEWTPARFRHYHDLVEQYIQEREEALLRPDAHLPAELRQLPQGRDGDAMLRDIISGYGRLMEAWPAIRGAAANLIRSGRRDAILRDCD